MSEIKIFYRSPLDRSKYGWYSESNVVVSDFYSQESKSFFDIPSSLREILSSYDLGDSDPRDLFLGISFTDDGTLWLLKKYGYPYLDERL